MRSANALALLLGLVLLLPSSAGAHELRLRDAPAFVETIGSERHRAVVINLHGGGWYMTGREVALSERPYAHAWATRGWTAVNASYRPHRRALPDALALYDRLRRHVGRTTPICLAGTSSGGHLALMVAVHRRDVACVVARGAPTDLVGIHRQSVRHPGGQLTRSGPKQLRRMAVEAFGRRNLGAMSPARHAGRIRARVLLAIGERDALVPWPQATRMAQAVPNARVMRLAWAREVEWVHTAITRAAFDDVVQAELALAEAVYRTS